MLLKPKYFAEFLKLKLFQQVLDGQRKWNCFWAPRIQRRLMAFSQIAQSGYVHHGGAPSKKAIACKSLPALSGSSLKLLVRLKKSH